MGGTGSRSNWHLALPAVLMCDQTAPALVCHWKWMLDHREEEEKKKAYFVSELKIPFRWPLRYVKYTHTCVHARAGLTPALCLTQCRGMGAGYRHSSDLNSEQKSLGL